MHVNNPDFLILIQSQLESLEKKISTQIYSDSPIVEQMLRYTLSGKGKRLRPALVLLSGHAVGPLTVAHEDISVAIELIHTATLVHDDIIDEATLRRQKTSLNAQYGNEMAVIFGDYLLAMAFSILAKLANIDVLNRITQVTHTICEGELFQTHRRFDFDLSKADYLKMIEQKTASLFAVSCRLGSLLAGGSLKQQITMENFGLELGMAFQIMDDCLDILGDEERTGKSLGTDIKKGKWTLPLLHLREAMKKTDWEDVRVLLFEDMQEMRLRRLVDYLVQYEAMDRTLEDVQIRIENAKACLDAIPNGPALAALCDFADDVLERHRKIFKDRTTSAIAHSA